MKTIKFTRFFEVRVFPDRALLVSSNSYNHSCDYAHLSRTDVGLILEVWNNFDAAPQEQSVERRCPTCAQHFETQADIDNHWKRGCSP